MPWMERKCNHTKCSIIVKEDKKREDLKTKETMNKCTKYKTVKNMSY
jgi:hypothetical protein